MKKTLTQIIREKTPLLVDSYVEQYGEKYRDVIQKKIDDANFVFYINPDDIGNIQYIVCDNLERLATFHFLRKLGADEKELEVDTNNELLPFKDKMTTNILMAFFDKPFFNSDPDYINNYFGIYSFLIDGENDFEHFNILKERIDILNKLHLTDIEEKDYLDFEHSDLYRNASEIYKRIAIVALRYAIAIQDEYSEVLNIYHFVYSKNMELKRKYMKRMVMDLADLLPSETQAFIEDNPDFELEKLYGGNLLFDLNSLKDTVDIFGPGLLETFSYECDLVLKDDFSEDNPIIDCRLEYFQRQGICFSKKYFFDNMDEILNKYKYILPSSEVTKRITEIRERYEILYAKEAALNMVLEGDISGLNIEDIELMFDIETGGYHMSEYDGDGAKSFVFVNPLHSYHGEELDHLIDHEIRHIIEFNYLINGNTIEYKIGNAVSSVDEGGFTDKHFTEFNEAYTDILSIRACEKRWNEGQYIFAPKIYLPEKFGTDFILDGYSDWFCNLEKIISGCEEKLTKTRMDYTNSRFYKFLSFEDWQRVNDLITEESEDVSRELEKFASKIKRKLKR